MFSVSIQKATCWPKSVAVSFRLLKGAALFCQIIVCDDVRPNDHRPEKQIYAHRRPALCYYPLTKNFISRLFAGGNL